MENNAVFRKPMGGCFRVRHSEPVYSIIAAPTSFKKDLWSLAKKDTCRPELRK